MPDQEIENKVKQIIVDELGVDENESLHARFIDDLALIRWTRRAGDAF